MHRDSIDYDSLLRLAKTLEGQTLRTNAGRAKFTVRVAGDELFFTPLSSGLERLQHKTSTERVIRYYNDTRSMKTTDYTSMTVNVVYMLRLIKLMEDDGQ